MATLKVKTSLRSTFTTDTVNSALYRLSYPYGRIVIPVIQKADSTALPATAYKWRKCLKLSIIEHFKDNQILAQCYRFYQNQFNSKLVKHTKYLVKNWRWHNFNVTGFSISNYAKQSWAVCNEFDFPDKLPANASHHTSAHDNTNQVYPKLIWLSTSEISKCEQFPDSPLLPWWLPKTVRLLTKEMLMPLALMEVSFVTRVN